MNDLSILNFFYYYEWCLFKCGGGRWWVRDSVYWCIKLSTKVVESSTTLCVVHNRLMYDILMNIICDSVHAGEIRMFQSFFKIWKYSPGENYTYFCWLERSFFFKLANAASIGGFGSWRTRAGNVTWMIMSSDQWRQFTYLVDVNSSKSPSGAWRGGIGGWY